MSDPCHGVRLTVKGPGFAYEGYPPDGWSMTVGAYRLSVRVDRDQPVPDGPIIFEVGRRRVHFIVADAPRNGVVGIVRCLDCPTSSFLMHRGDGDRETSEEIVAFARDHSCGAEN